MERGTWNLETAVLIGGSQIIIFLYKAFRPPRLLVYLCVPAAQIFFYGTVRVKLSNSPHGTG